jgi:hypothetical protein
LKGEVACGPLYQLGNKTCHPSTSLTAGMNNIPSEIISKILKEVTLEWDDSPDQSDLVDPSDYEDQAVAHNPPNPSKYVQPVDTNDSLRRMYDQIRSLTLVCKAWHPFAEEMLYSRIFIKDLKSLRRLSRHIGEKGNRYGTDGEKGVTITGGICLGWWTRVVHLKLNDNSYNMPIDAAKQRFNDSEDNGEENRRSTEAQQRPMNRNPELLLKILRACSRIHTLHVCQDDSADMTYVNHMRSWFLALSNFKSITKCTWHRVSRSNVRARISPFEIIQPLSSSVTDLVIESRYLDTIGRNIAFPHVRRLRLDSQGIDAFSSQVSSFNYTFLLC